MRATCCICSDILDEVQPISATACGHVYHSNCLMLWVGQCKTCPICRSRVKSESILKLYFDIPQHSALNSSVLENEVLNLKAQLSAKDIEIDAMKKQKESTRAYAREAEKISAELQQAMYKNESEIAELKLRLKSAAKLEAKVLKLEQMNMAITNDLQLLNNVQSIVSGTQKDVDDMIRGCANGSEASKQMATYCTILKRELQKVIDSKNKLTELNSKLKQENGRYAAKVKFYEDAMAISSKDNSFIQGTSPKCSVKENLKPGDINYGASTSKASTVTVSKQSNNPEIIDIDVSPLSVPFNKSKFSMNIASSSKNYRSEINIEKSTSGFSSVTVKERKNDNSIIRTGYNGLGGHSNFINGTSGIKRFRSMKRK